MSCWYTLFDSTTEERSAANVWWRKFLIRELTTILITDWTVYLIAPVRIETLSAGLGPPNEDCPPNMENVSPNRLASTSWLVEIDCKNSATTSSFENVLRTSSFLLNHSKSVIIYETDRCPVHGDVGEKNYLWTDDNNCSAWIDWLPWIIAQLTRGVHKNN